MMSQKFEKLKTLLKELFQLDQPDLVLRRGMSGYLLAFEIISVHLVVVLVGAAYLARAKRSLPAHPKHCNESPD